MSMQNALSRFARLLTLVPFLQTHQGIATADAAVMMGITESELVADLYLLWMCGLPGYSHLELIDLDFESGHISIQNADTLAKPLSRFPWGFRCLPHFRMPN
jgi:proteasome accessory factor C